MTLSSNALSSYAVPVPTSLSGDVSVRVVDTDRKQNENVVDTVQIYYMAFVSRRTSPLPPTVSVIASDPLASESGPDAGAFRIELTEDEALPNDLTVHYSIAGTADGSDFVETLSGTAIIPAGQLSVTLPITPVDDAIEESNETLVVQLAGDTAYRLGGSGQATVNIADNDLVAFLAQSEATTFGTTAGSYFDTHASDGSTEDITEDLYAGRKKSRVNHEWSFNLQGETDVEFMLDAQHQTAGDPDAFDFEISTNGGSSWQSLLSVAPGSPAMQSVALTLPGGTSTVLVRVTDSSGARDSSAATLSIDMMMFRRIGALPAEDTGEATRGNSRFAEAAAAYGRWLIEKESNASPVSGILRALLDDGEDCDGLSFALKEVREN